MKPLIIPGDVAGWLQSNAQQRGHKGPYDFAVHILRAAMDGSQVSFTNGVTQVKDRPQSIQGASTEDLILAVLQPGELWVVELVKLLEPHNRSAEQVHVEVDRLLAAGQIRSRTVIHGVEPRRMLSLAPSLS